MAFNLLKEALLQTRFSDKQNTTITILESVVDTATARRIVESYQVTEADYKKWLDVIQGYAREEGHKISSKNVFAEIAGSVIENDPSPIDQDMQEAIINVLWAKYKTQKQRSKVEKVAKAREEEEQLNFALNKMRGNQTEENEEKSSWFYDLGVKHKKSGQKPIPQYAPFDKESDRVEYDRGYAEGALKNKERGEENEEYGPGTLRRRAGLVPNHTEEYGPSTLKNRLGLKPREEDKYGPGTLKKRLGYEEEEPSKAYDIGFTHGVDGKKQVTQYAHFGKAWTSKYNRGFAAGRAANTKSEEDEEYLEVPEMPDEDDSDDTERLYHSLDNLRSHTSLGNEAHLPQFKKKPRNPRYEEEESGFSQLFRASQGMEDEESDDYWRDLEPPDIDDNSEDDTKWEKVLDPGKYEDHNPNSYLNRQKHAKFAERLKNRLPTEEEESDDVGYTNSDFEQPFNNKYDNLDDEDYDAVNDDEHTNKERDLEDYDEDDLDLDDATIDQGYDRTEERDEEDDDSDDEDMEVYRKGREHNGEMDVDDFESEDEDEYEHKPVGNGSILSRKSRQSEENEELADKGSKFHKGQLVTCKKLGNKNCKVEIPDGKGDYVGVMDGGRITMILTKDLLPVEQPVEDEEVESTSNQGSKVSFLNDLLTGSNTSANMKKLQDEIEIEAHNAYMKHHAKAPQSPHPKGSIAHKAWMKGFQNAGKSIYAPKVVVDTVKPKAKKKK